MDRKKILQGRLLPSMSFNEKVLTLTARIPAGKVSTYGQIAKQLNTKACRAVGNALNKNPFLPDVPCHRVVGHDGSLTGYAGGLAKKRRMLKQEGVAFAKDKVDRNCFVNA